MRRLRRFPIAAKFAVMLAVLVAALLAVGFTGLRGLSNLNDHVNGLYRHVVTLQRTTAFATDTATAAKVAFQIIVSNSALEIAHLEDQLTNEIVPRVNGDLEGLRAAHAPRCPGRASEGVPGERILDALSGASKRQAAGFRRAVRLGWRARQRSSGSGASDL
jgi:hypothetical protein